MVCESRWDNPFGLQETIFTGLTNEYLEAIEKYTDTVKYYVGCATSTRDVRKNLHGVEFGVLTEKECVPNGMNTDLDGKVIIIKAESLSPQYQTADYQLRFCNGGFGTRPNSRGRAVFCTDLFEDKKSRFEREDVLGVADISLLPEWAQKRIATVKQEKDVTVEKQPDIKTGDFIEYDNKRWHVDYVDADTIKLTNLNPLDNDKEIRSTRWKDHIKEYTVVDPSEIDMSTLKPNKQKPSLADRIEKGKEKVREADKNKAKPDKPKNKNKGVDD